MSLPDHPTLGPLTSASRLSIGDRTRGRAKRLSSTNVPSALRVVCVIALCVAGFRSVGVHLLGRLIGGGGRIEILEIVA